MTQKRVMAMTAYDKGTVLGCGCGCQMRVEVPCKCSGSGKAYISSCGKEMKPITK